MTREWRQRNPHASSKALVKELKVRSLTRPSKMGTRNLVSPDVVPAEWIICRMEDVCSEIVDGTHFTPTYVEQGVHFVSVKDIQGGEIDFSDTKKISASEHSELSERCNPTRNDVLITKSGTIGRCAIVNTDDPFSLFVSVALIRPAGKGLRSEFLKYALEYWVSTIDTASEITGTAIKNLHLQDIKALGVPIPSTVEQDKLIAAVTHALDWIDRLASEATSARKLVDHLDQAVLAKAFRGELLPQDPNDEPASVLLERIRAERASAPRDHPSRTRSSPGGRKA